MKRILIIGGGAAGLMAASAASEKYGKSAEVAVIEKNRRPARKLMITGKGRCNVTNNCSLDELISNTPVNARFLYSAFSSFLPDNTMSFFEKRGVPLKTERGKRVFPVSDKAVDIVDALVNSVKKAGVQIINASAAGIQSSDGSVSGVCLSDGRFLTADSVVIATGGLSYPVTGSTGDGFRFAENLGHTVTELRPSLVPIECHEGFCSRLSGLSLKNVRLSVYEEGRKKPVYSDMGEMLFTHFGISGPLVLTASAYIKSMGKKKYNALVDLKPALTYEELDNRILRDFSEFKNKDFINSLDKLLPKSIIPVAVTLCGIDPHTKVNSVDRESRRKLCTVIKNLPLTLTRFRPVEEAIITRGGVSVKEINPSTMESKIIKGLFFAGEVIDADGLTGGFNLQIAFSTGYAAGRNA